MQDNQIDTQGAQPPKISFADLKRLEKLISIERISSDVETFRKHLDEGQDVTPSDDLHLTRASSHKQDSVLLIRLPKSKDPHIMTPEEADNFKFAIDTIRKIQGTPLSSTDFRHTCFKKGYLLIDLPWQVSILETVCKNAFLSKGDQSVLRS